MMKKKKVRFKPQYKLLSWNPDKSYKQEKTIRTDFNNRIDMRPQENIEEEMVFNHEQMYENKREVCSNRIASRDMAIQSTINPYMINNDYLEDLNNQATFLRPCDSNIKSSENKYLKVDNH